MRMKNAHLCVQLDSLTSVFSVNLYAALTTSSKKKMARSRHNPSINKASVKWVRTKKREKRTIALLVKALTFIRAEVY